MTNAEVISKLRAAKGQIPEIAAGSGVPEKTLLKIFYGETTNPRMDTLDNLREWFERKPKARAS